MCITVLRGQWGPGKQQGLVMAGEKMGRGVRSSPGLCQDCDFCPEGAVWKSIYACLW